MKQPLVLVICAWLAACGGEKDDAAKGPAKPAEQPAASDKGVDGVVRRAEELGDRAQAAAKDVGTAARAVAEAQAAKAAQLATEAVKDAAGAQEKVMQLEKTAADMMEKINGAITAVEAAQSDADRTAAKAKLIALQAEQAAMQVAIAAAKAAAAKAARLKGVKISPECLDNPLAKGCS